MRLEQLEYLTAVVQHGSLRQAAQRLHVSQPALSEAVGKLERELGVTLLDRRRSGARVSRQGHELLGPVVDVLEAVERLRAAASDQHATDRVVRVGTVNTATSTLVAPAIRDLQDADPGTQVEVVDLQQREIRLGLEDGSLDLGLVNSLAGDQTPAALGSTVLVHGSPVVVLPAGHRLAEERSITVEDLRAERFVAMREGYLMHRFAHRLFGATPPVTTYSTDGAAMGKLMVAEGLGLTILPDYSVSGDPLHRAGLIVHRPIRGDRTTVSLEMWQRRGDQATRTVAGLRAALLRRARAYLAGSEPA